MMMQTSTSEAAKWKREEKKKKDFNFRHEKNMKKLYAVWDMSKDITNPTQF
jgi:hypothetical protein